MNSTKTILGQEKKYLYDFIVVIVILNSLGFPGNYEKILGGTVSTIVDYSCFLMEIVTMLFSSGEDIFDVKLVNLENKYKGIYLIVFVFAADSMLVTRYPGLQLITCLRLATTVFFILWICDQYNEEDIIRLSCAAQTLFVFFTLIFIIMRPDVAFNSISGEMSFVGLHTTKNASARELLIGVMIFAIYFKNQSRQKKEISRLFYITMFLQITLLILCNSASALLTVLMTAFYVLFLSEKMGVNKRIPLAWMFVLGSIGFLVVAMTILPLFSGLFEMIGKDVTLTGRTPLWEQIIKVMQENHTLTGYGYAMFWRDESAVELLHGAFSSQSFLGNMTSGAHNFLLECWLNVGLIGIAALFLGMFDCMKKISELSVVQYDICSAIFILCMVSGFTERAFSSAYSYDVFFLFLAMGIACNRKRIKES